MKQILIVKLTSMGDVIQALPIVADLQREYPGVQIDWAVDSQFAAFPKQHPGIRHVFAFPLRGHKKKKKWELLSELFGMIGQLRKNQYDAIIDCHGMIKSGLITYLARGSLRCGFAKDYLGESSAAYAYNKTMVPTPGLPRVERLREVAAKNLGYPLQGLPEFGLQRLNIEQRLPWLPANPYLVFLHSTTEALREWPEQNWLELGQQARWSAFNFVLPWGNANEKQRAERIASKIPRAIVAPKMDLYQCGQLLAAAAGVVGVDTGLTHLAYAYDVPTVGLLANEDPAHVSPYWSKTAVALGESGVWPEPEVVGATLYQLAGLS